MDHLVSIDCGRNFLVRDVGCGKAEAVWTHPDRVLDFHVFLYILSGSFQVWEDGTEYVLEAGETFFLKKNVHHWGSPRTKPGTSWYWISLFDPPEPKPDEATLRRKLETYQDTAQLLHPDQYEYRIDLPKRFKVSQPNYFVSRFRSLYELYLSPSPHRPALLAVKTAELLVELHQQSLKSRKMTTGDVTVQQIIEIIGQMSATRFHSRTVSRALNLNYNYLSSLFRQRTGMSISQYHAMVRINKAIELLRETDTNVTEVSDRLGFPNPFHFSRVFKKNTGLSPSQYMNQIYR